MDKRTQNIIIITAITLICSCLPLCLGAIGFINAIVDEDIIDLNENSVWYGLAGICLSILGFLIAGGVAILLLRKKSETVLPPEEPLPPAI